MSWDWEFEVKSVASKKWSKWAYRNWLTDAENKLMAPKGKREFRDDLETWEWHAKLMYIKQVSNMYSTGSYIQYFIITYMVKESEK